VKPYFKEFAKLYGSYFIDNNYHNIVSIIQSLPLIKRCKLEIKVNIKHQRCSVDMVSRIYGKMGRMGTTSGKCLMKVIMSLYWLYVTASVTLLDPSALFC